MTLGYNNLILVDDFSHAEKEPNLAGKKYLRKIEREIFFEWLEKEKPAIEFIFHIGARTDTTEFDYSIHEHLNVEYSKKIWKYCAQNHIPLVYASSAATYGAGELGYEDSHEIIDIYSHLILMEFQKMNLINGPFARQEQQVGNDKAPPAGQGLNFLMYMARMNIIKAGWQV